MATIVDTGESILNSTDRLVYFVVRTIQRDLNVPGRILLQAPLPCHSLVCNVRKNPICASPCQISVNSGCSSGLPPVTQSQVVPVRLGFFRNAQPLFGTKFFPLFGNVLHFQVDIAHLTVEVSAQTCRRSRCRQRLSPTPVCRRGSVIQSDDMPVQSRRSRFVITTFPAAGQASLELEIVQHIWGCAQRCARGLLRRPGCCCPPAF